MQSFEAYLGGADKVFDAQGELTNDTTRQFLQNFVNAFGQWIAVHGKS